MSGRTLRLLGAVVALVLSAVSLAALPGAAEEDAGTRLVLSVGGDGSGLELVAPGARDGVVLGPAHEAAERLAWDLSELDAAAFRSDLVRLEVVRLDGPGRLTVHTDAPHARRALVFDGSVGASPGPAMVLQLGRVTTQEWQVDRPGPHTVEIRASIPLVAGGTADTTLRLHLGGPATPDPAPQLLPSRTGQPAAAPGGSAPAQAGERIVIADGHVDIGPAIVDGRWRVQMKDDTVTPYVWRNLEDVVLHVRDAAVVEVPDRPAYAFLGSPGTRYHILPQGQVPGVVWPGWNSQHPTVLEAVPGSVTWRLRGVDGPGRFAIFLTDSFGDTRVLFDSNESLPQDLTIPRNSHVHGNWAFGAPGIYRLAVEMRATLDDGTAVSDVRTLVIAVGDGTDPSIVPPDDPGDPGQPLDVDPGGQGDGVGISTDLGAGGGRSPGSGRDGLARTGVEAAGLVAVAAGLIGLGVLLRLRARRTSR